MSWTLFQLAFDVILFSIIIYLTFQLAKSGAPDTGELRAILRELKETLAKSETAAREMERRLQALRETPPAPATSVKKSRPDARPTSAPLFPAADVEPVDGDAERSLQDHRKKVAALHKHGMRNEEISKQLSLPLPEVELIVAMLETGK